MWLILLALSQRLTHTYAITPRRAILFFSFLSWVSHYSLTNSHLAPWKSVLSGINVVDPRERDILTSPSFTFLKYIIIECAFATRLTRVSSCRDRSACRIGRTYLGGVRRAPKFAYVRMFRDHCGDKESEQDWSTKARTDPRWVPRLSINKLSHHACMYTHIHSFVLRAYAYANHLLVS